MIRRRTRFVAPFVLVVGCSGAGTVPPPPPPLRPEPLPIDAAIDAPVDAAPIDAPLDALPPDAPVLDRAQWKPDFPRCSTSPDPRRELPTCNPSAPQIVEARIIKIDVNGSDSLITVGVSDDARIDKTWRAELLDDGGRIVKSSPLVIIRADRRLVLIRVPGLTEVRQYPRVRLSPR